MNFSSSGGILGYVYLVRLINAFVCAVANNSDLQIKPYEFDWAIQLGGGSTFGINKATLPRHDNYFNILPVQDRRGTAG